MDWIGSTYRLVLAHYHHQNHHLHWYHSHHHHLHHHHHLQQRSLSIFHLNCIRSQSIIYNRSHFSCFTLALTLTEWSQRCRMKDILVFFRIHILSQIWSRLWKSFPLKSPKMSDLPNGARILKCLLPKLGLLTRIIALLPTSSSSF